MKERKARNKGRRTVKAQTGHKNYQPVGAGSPLARAAGPTQSKTESSERASAESAGELCRRQPPKADGGTLLVAAANVQPDQNADFL